MSTLLSPAVGVMNRLSVQGKMLLLGLIAMVSVVVLAYMLLARVEGDIAFSEKETQTAPLVMPARHLMQALQTHRGVAQGMIGGNTSLAGKLAELRAEADKAIAEGDAASARFGEGLGVSADWAALRQGWGEVQAKAVSVSSAESFKLHTDYIARVRNFITLVADKTNATLDPELETYYLMDLFTVRLPALAEDAGRARALGTALAIRQHSTEAERIDMNVFMRRLADGREGVEAAIVKVGSNGQVLRARLEVPGQNFDAAVKGLGALVDEHVLKGADVSIGATQVFEEGSKAVDASYAILDVAAQEFDRYLQLRLQRLYMARWTAIGVILFSLLVVGYLFLGFRRTMLDGIGEIQAGVRRMADGGLDEPVNVSSHDAFGEIATALNAMQASLKARLLAEHEVAEANLRVRNALDKASTNIMLADNDGQIVYCNDAVIGMLRDAEADIRRDLPSFSVAGLVGRNFDDFHQNPAHQRNVLGRLQGEHKASVRVGGRTFALVANPVVNAQGVRLGSVVEWQDRTNEVRVEQELAGLLDAAVAGDFARRLSLEGKAGFFATVAEGMNNLMGIVSTSLEDLARVLNAIARGDLTEKITAEYSGTFGQLKDDTNTTVERLREVVGQIKESAESINVAAQEISAGNSDL
ncbi:MAG: HAMP domain-containing protein, partial [Proteobacteria bacterium]|nr:HAMP domain-containing protein [Pseudomonadota bacterium]